MYKLTLGTHSPTRTHSLTHPPTQSLSWYIRIYIYIYYIYIYIHHIKYIIGHVQTDQHTPPYIISANDRYVFCSISWTVLHPILYYVIVNA